ncbi:hypothetical protein Tco_1321084 [Tanacetum coccineum]
MSQDVMICVMDSTTVFDDSVNAEMHSSEFYVKCLDLDAELLNKQNAYNDLSKSYSQLENIAFLLKYFENNDLKAQLQAKDTTICKLKEHIKSMREKDKEEKVKHDTDETEAINIELEHRMFKLDLDPLAHRLLKNRDAHIDYLKYTQEQADILWRRVEQAKAKQPLDNALDFAFVTPMNKVKKVRFSEPFASSSNIHKQVESSKTPDSNTPVLPSIGLKSSTSASRS